LTKLTALSKTPEFYTKRQPVTAVDRVTQAPRQDAEGKTFTVMQILPDYDRMLRQLFADAHGHHKRFKLKRLTRELAAPADTEETAAAA
jgi:hypothetical protein